MSTDTRSTTGWGPLAEPIHGPVPDGRPAWKDNAYLCFWDHRQEVLGVAHVSTSPNAEGRRARFSLSIRGRQIEIVEELDPGTFNSDSIAFGLDGTIVVDSPELSGTLITTPIFGLADFSKNSIIPPLIADEPLQHFQRAVEVEGKFSFRGEDATFAGVGFRDRTWGYRDESASIAEYIAFMVVFPDWAMTAMRFHSPDGSNRTEGYVLDDTDHVPAITDIKVTRNACGLLESTVLPMDDGSQLSLQALGTVGGFWVPMGWTRCGPTMSAYDEFGPLRDGTGAEGFGMVEHGILRNLY